MLQIIENMQTAVPTKLKFNENCLYRDLYLLNMSKGTVAITSGYANPIHIGHIHCFRDCKTFGHHLIAIVNSDSQVKIKGSQPFMDEKERLEIVQSIRYVDYTLLAIDNDGTVCETLREIAKMLPDCRLTFCKGGDSRIDNVPELTVCNELGIKVFFNVGGVKIQSSSWLLKKAKEE